MTRLSNTPNTPAPITLDVIESAPDVFTPTEPEVFDAPEPSPLIAELDESATRFIGALNTAENAYLADMVVKLVQVVTEQNDAIRTIGAQQQWTTDAVTKMFGQFAGAMQGPGGIMKMLGQIMKGGGQ